MHHRLGAGGRLLTPLTACVASAVVCGAVAHHHRDRRLPQLRWTSTAVEAVSGAAGEVAQIALLYPLDTVKVRCQAAGLNSRQVVAQLWAASRGSLSAFLAACYAGAVPAAALSILVGATHYCCFCATRRAVVRLTAGSSSSQQHAGQHVLVSHGATGTHFVPVDDALCEPEQLAAAAAVSSSSSSSSSSRGASAHEQQVAASAAAGGDAPMSQQVDGEGSLMVNVVSAVITAGVTALVESPLELFRHNSQAGHVAGNFLPAMVKVVRKHGPRSLYYGLLPYCLEAGPYDISELLVVGVGKDLRHHPGVQGVAPAAYDLAVGAVAGAVAVLVSQPCDVIKTFIQCSSSSRVASANLGVAGSAAVFLSTGKALVRRGGGPQALFVGLAPRLCHQVPGAMVCWGVIEATHRCLSEVCLQQATDRARTCR